METLGSPEFVVFTPEDRVHLEDLTDQEFDSEFKDYRYLLILDRGQVVVGGTTGEDRDALEEAYRNAFPDEDESPKTLLCGPATMQQNVAAGYVGRVRSGRKNGPAK